MKKVSILIPVYNLGKYKKYLSVAIKSILLQTYNNWELIIIDDGSTDGTSEYIDKYLNILNDKIKKKIKLIKNKSNYGCYVSLNKGIDISTGDYITRLDSDDVYHRNKLLYQVYILNKYNKFIATRCGFQEIKSKKIFNFNSVSLMFRRKVINEMGYYDSVLYDADTEFHRRLMKKYGMKKIYVSNHIHYFVNKRENSLTTSKLTGVKKNTIGYEHRENYKKHSKQWQDTTTELYIGFPLYKRPFSCNNAIISKYDPNNDNI